MAIVERHKSPDGLLELVVDLADDGDWTIGLVGFAPHTHGGILTWRYGGTPESAVRTYVDDVISSRRVIVISRIDGKIREAWITDDPSRNEMEYAEPGETIEKRFWNGHPAAG